MRRFLVPGLLVWFVASEDSNWELWLMLLFLPFTAHGLLHYWTLRYAFASDELVLTSGLVFKTERHIPFTRIHNIDLIRNPVHRLLGVAMVRIETASGSEAEAELSVLSMEAVTKLRARISREKAAPAREGLRDADGAERVAAGSDPAADHDNAYASNAELGLPPPLPGERDVEDLQPDEHDAERDAEHFGLLGEGELLHRLEFGDLLRLGLIVNRGFAMVAAMLGISWELGFFEKIDPEGWFDRFLGLVPGFPWLLAVIFVVVLGMIALALLSIFWTLLRFHGYELREHGDDLRIECGLLTRMAATVPRHRIQFVSIVRSPLHRLLGCSTIHIETAGGLEDEDKATVLRKSFVPVVPKDQAQALATRLVPALAQPGDPRPLARNAARRAVRPAIAMAILLVFAACGVFGVEGLLAMILLPLLAVRAFVWARRARWSIGSDAVLWQEGVLTQRRSATRIDKIQSVAISASPFDRRWHMARLSIDTAGSGPAGHRISLPYLRQEVAEAVSRDLAARADSREFRW